MKFSYIKYLFQATNQHGVHSPFVYSMITKALYKKQKLSEYPLLSVWKEEHSFSKRKQKIINKALHYFNDESFKTSHNDAFRSNKTAYFTLKKNSPEHIIKKTKTYSFFIIDHINESKQLKNRWTEIKKIKKFSISMDFYNIGFLFIRQEQVKEDFKIRI